MKTYISLFALILTCVLMVPSAHAVSIPCTILSRPLYYGLTDASTNGDISRVQTFLSMEGYFSGPIIGRFGPLTFAAVLKFQAAQGLPSVGVVGPLTRAAIKNVSCQIVPPPRSEVYMQSISPVSGPVGTTVTISGWGFTNDNLIHFGIGAIAHVPVTSSIAIACTTDPACHPGIRQILTFTVPESLGPYCAPGMMCALYLQQVTPGAYNLFVQNDNGISNTSSFIVTDNNQTAMTITGLDAPSALTIGNVGSWTVHVSVPGGSSTNNLHYSVVWGDENTSMTTMAGIMMPQPSNVQSSATFTHAYQRSGTYQATFTVTDDAGHSANVSSTVNVSPIY